MEALRNYLNDLPPHEQAVFAIKCGTTINYLRKRISDRTALLGEKICIEIEDNTNGKVRCEDLRPDVNWAVLRKRG